MNETELPKDAYANQCPKCKAEVFTVFIQGDIYWKCEKCGTLTIQKTLPHFPYDSPFPMQKRARATVSTTTSSRKRRKRLDRKGEGDDGCSLSVRFSRG